MGRPEHVRCENCCYWDASVDGDEAICARFPGTVNPNDSECIGIFPWTDPNSWCGEFRAEWPGKEWSLADWMSRHKEATSGGSPST